MRVLTFSLTVILALSLLLAAGCQPYTLPSSQIPPPTRTPLVPLPDGLPTTTPTRLLLTPSPRPLPQPSPTFSPTPTPRPTQQPKLNLIINACDTGLDIFNGLGEVTNAYVTLQNVGQVDVAALDVTLSASDEGKVHPDKSYHLQYLPAGYEIVLKLTVDTQNGKDTSITATANDQKNLRALAVKASCNARRPDKDILNSLGKLFEMRKM